MQGLGYSFRILNSPGLPAIEAHRFCFSHRCSGIRMRSSIMKAHCNVQVADELGEGRVV